MEECAFSRRIARSLPASSTIITAKVRASLYDNAVQAGFAGWRQSQSVLSVCRPSKSSHCITP